MGDATASQTGPEEHRRLGVDLFNGAWELMRRQDRSAEDDLLMLSMTHASAYHWGRAGAGPEHHVRGQWQISRVHTVLGQGEAALYHALACVRICEEHEIGDWDVAFAHEAVARACLILGDRGKCAAEVAIAERLGAAIADPEDLEVLEQDLATLRG